jgi:hypothetical protein
LNRQIARGVKVYEARRALAGCQLLSGDFHGAVATTASTLAKYQESASPHSEYKKQFEVRDGYLFAAACMAEAGETGESLKWIERRLRTQSNWSNTLLRPTASTLCKRCSFVCV